MYMFFGLLTFFATATPLSTTETEQRAREQFSDMYACLDTPFSKPAVTSDDRWQQWVAVEHGCNGWIQDFKATQRQVGSRKAEFTHFAQLRAKAQKSWSQKKREERLLALDAKFPDLVELEHEFQVLLRVYYDDVKRTQKLKTAYFGDPPEYPVPDWYTTFTLTGH